MSSQFPLEWKEETEVFRLVLSHRFSIDRTVIGVFYGVSVAYPGAIIPPMRLSLAIIESAQPRSSGYKLYDGCHSLHLYVTPTGTKSWRLRYRRDGREQLKTLGTYPVTKLEDARLIAAEARAEMKGIVAVAASSAALNRRLGVAPALMVERLRHLASLPIEAGLGIYFVAAADGNIKIGKSRDVPRRLAEMQVGQAGALRLLAVMPGSSAHERALHAAFAGHKIRGEWFAPTAALLAFIRGFEPDAPC